MWYYLVHIPLEAKKEYVEYFEKKKRDLSLDKEVEFEKGDFFPCEHKKDKRIIRRLIQSDCVYAAMIKSLDENIGRLFDALKETGQYDDTIIFFTSDNGGLSSAEGSPTCNKPLSEGKGWMYDGGVREPLIIKWKDNIKAGTSIDEMAISMDFYPTILAMAGMESEKQTDGLSLCRILKKETHKLNRKAVFWHYPHYGNQGGTPGSAVRMGKYKLIEFYEPGRYELYDLENDIGEEEDLISQKPDIAKEMIELLNEWKASVCAKTPGKNPDFIPWSRNHTELI
jgi:arylsulfatase A-like enzyme